MIKFSSGKKVMADHRTLMKRPDGKRGVGGVLVLYGVKRLTGTIDTIAQDHVWIKPIGSNWRFKVAKDKVMEYDSNNDTLVCTGNSMYDNGPINLDDTE